MKNIKNMCISGTRVQDLLEVIIFMVSSRKFLRIGFSVFLTLICVGEEQS